MKPQTPEVKDEELVLLTLKESSAFGQIIERYEAKLRRYISRLGVRNPDDATDVLQEIFIKAYVNLNSFDTSLSFSSWIYRIAHNEAISWYRKQNVRPEGHLIIESDEVLNLLSSKQDGPELLFDRQINAAELNKALSKLEPKYLQVLLLRYFEEKEYSEISDILRLPIGSVGTLIARGKKQLQTVLNRDNLRI
ncbi:MAG TPA: RNA polymerase sigma factor [Candidatus Paceibacterota bacterium]|nr:RNA polymerase sigma factor [Candidatus Paceibacterota bacterium]